MANPVELLTCPARQASQDVAIRSKTGMDFWMSRGPDRAICSYCESLSPDEFLDWCHRCKEPDSKVIVDPATDIPGKYHLARRGVTNARQGAIKFYAYHFKPTEDGAVLAERHRLIGDAIEASVPRMRPRA